MHRRFYNRAEFDKHMKMVIEKVSDQIRQNHQTSVRLGRLGRADSLIRLRGRTVAPVSPLFVDDAEDDDLTDLDNP